MSATYSPEDNKLRLYVGRVPRDDYDRLREAGFISTPKQSCDFVATWTPAREDLAREFLDDDEDIGDEDYSPEERAADRAERFASYRDKRRDEANGSADRFEAGPSAFGHQNRDRAERQARRHDRHRTYAVSQWSKAEYWQARTAGVISHALHKSSAPVRRGRILTLEAELRGITASYTPADDPPSYIMQTAWNDSEPSQHVWCGPKGRGGRWVKVSDLESLRAGNARWVTHYEMRLMYERAMLENEGGSASEAEMEPGGWIGRHQIQAVNKSPVTGRVVSVKLLAPKPYWRGPGEAPLTLQSFNIERLGSSAYRAPTDEEREQFKTATKQRKAEAKAAKPKAPPLINPTDEDAERLQSLWNERAAAAHKRQRGYGDAPVATVLRMTQELYSAASKGSYARCNTIDITEQLRERRQSAMSRELNGRVTVFKIRRTSCGGGFSMYAPDRVIIITDKPQKPIPWDECDAVRSEQPTVESMTPRLGELQAALSLNWLPKEGTDEATLIDDAVYLGWAFVSSQSQFGWTDSGMAAFKDWMRSEKPELAATH